MKNQNVLKRWASLQVCIAFIAIVLAFLLYYIPASESFQKYRLGALLLMFVAIVFSQVANYYWVIVPFNKVKSYLNQLSKGKAVSIAPSVFSQFPIFKFISRVNNRYLKLSQFVDSVIDNEAGNVAEDIDVFAKTEQCLSTHLDKIKAEENKWRLQEQVRSWTNQGIAQFSELLRQSTGSVELVSQELLRGLIKYLNGNQGGVFVKKAEEDESLLYMVASYAYDREKCPDKTARLDDGLLAAVCFEKKTIVMTDIPESYLEIRSGTGSASPNFLILVPLIHDENVLGVVEMASFKILEQHEIEFVEKVCQSFASTLSERQLGQTTTLLLEQSQKQAEELATQEEELRQNIEEMRAQQEEMKRKQYEIEENEKLMRTIIDLVPYPIFVKNINREYIVANRAQALLFNLKVDEMLGRCDDQLINSLDELEAILASDQKVLVDDQQIKLPEQSISLRDGTQRILQTIKVPFENNLTQKRNILGVSIDYTEQREIEQKLKESDKKVAYLSSQLEKMKN